MAPAPGGTSGHCQGWGEPAQPHYSPRGKASCQTPCRKIKATNKVSSQKLASAETTGLLRLQPPCWGSAPLARPKHSNMGWRSSSISWKPPEVCALGQQ